MTTSASIEKMQNPSIVLYGAKNAQLEDKPITEPLDPHHVLVRIAYVGVCGSDVSQLYCLTPNAYTNTQSRSISGTTAA
jgi:threonine dehydrogenase-like Zn-dependent dehydrogenase